MYNVRKTEKQLSKRIFRKARAVSPVVATLILIIVAIVGAIAVGLIVSRVSSDTSGQANVQGAATGSQGELFIGGSTTVYPIELALQAGFQSTYHLQLVLSQGGSDAGMQGVISGALNIGAASSTGAVNNAETDVVNNDIQGVTINPTLIGGSAVTVIESGPGTGGFLWDGTNACQGITKAALASIFSLGTFGIMGSAVTKPCDPAANFQTLDQPTTGVSPITSTTICSTVTSATTSITLNSKTVNFPACGAGDVYPISAVSRADNSGTEDQFVSYVGAPLQKQSAGGNFPGVTEQGNPGVLNYVNTHANSIGFVDLGFAEGAASGAVCSAGHATSTTCANTQPLSMPQVDTATPTALPFNAAAAAPAAGTNGYVATGGNTANIHSLILAALKSAAFVNPLTLAGQKAFYPDTAASGTGLARTFYLVTNGTPTIPEEQFLSYATNYNQEAAYTSNGYFSQYDMTSA